jgi:hypothetical protein
LIGVAVATACEGDKGDPGEDGMDAISPLGPADDLPGVNVVITSMTGGTVVGGAFKPGDTITVNFTLEEDDGEPIDLDTLNRSSIYVSGPTFNYQRVIISRSDVKDVAVDLGNGSYRYRYPVPIPTVYEEPINFDPMDTDDVLAGQALLDGTYTVAMEARKTFEILGESFRDVGNASADFRVQGAMMIEPREVVTLANCNECHGELRFHGGNRNDITNCLLCHTAGANGHDGVSIEFKVMVHKIHAGKHLPTVLGVTTNTDGSRKYDEPPQPYVVGGTDYSGVGFPVWPSLAAPTPRDTGYTSLTSGERGLEDTMRSAPVDCDKCHGDPDGNGPLPPPANGDLIYAQPTRRSCGACHDDWVWDRPYTSNMQTMPAQTSDSTCTLCHKAEGTALDIKDAHLHPLVNSIVAPGLTIDLTSVTEAPPADMDGTLDPGEKMQLEFRIVNDAGADVPPSELSRFEAAVSGPTDNPNLLLFTSISTAAVGMGPNYTMLMPERVYYELSGTSTGTPNEVFMTSRMPHLDLPSAETQVFLRTATASNSSLSLAAPVYQNFLDVQQGGGALFARDDFVVVEDGVSGQEEYFQIQFVDGDRLWLSSPATAAYRPNVGVNHALGSDVRVVTLTEKVEGTDYSLDTASGVITEIGEMGSGQVVVSYTTDFVIPTSYRGTLNDSPDLGERSGDWKGLAVVSGTYSVGMHAVWAFTVSPFGEPTGYNDASKPGTLNVLVGNAATLEPNERISSPQNCYACHNDIAFHGSGRRGYQTCLLCHGVAAAEDRPPYVAANAPATTGVTIDFRNMLHKIHQGKDLDAGDDYIVVGFGSGYPNNFTPHTYEEVGFPVLPGSTSNCRNCHGEQNTAWQAPGDRDYPGGLAAPQATWAIVCSSCHDDTAAVAHINANTSSSGEESCAVCHGPGKLQEVELVHKVR